MSFERIFFFRVSAIIACFALAIGCGDDSNAGAGAGGAAGTGGSAGSEPNPADELFELGSFEVGFQALELTYPAAASGDDRTLPTYVWYPVAAGTTGDAVTYAAAGINIAGNALDGAPVADGTFPVAVYSHGSGGEGQLTYPNAELLASHGWIVASPNHVGNTALDGLGGTSTPFARTALNRPADITAVIDWLESGITGDLAGAADTSSVLVYGHSFGAYTTLAAGGADQDFDLLNAMCTPMSMDDNCTTLADEDVEAAYRAGFGDPRVVAIAPQAPAGVPTFADGELAGLSVPTMLMTGRRDQTTTQEEQAVPAWMRLDNDGDIWVEIPDGGHYTFITVCDDIDPELLAAFISNFEEDGCGDTFVPVADSVPVLGAYLLGFGRLHVLGETQWESVLTGTPLDNRFVITTK